MRESVSRAVTSTVIAPTPDSARALPAASARNPATLSAALGMKFAKMNRVRSSTQFS